ncbi:unnamed protein product [Owenia fusiformis]|uniref:Arginase n=1 Tax=Owenia fusiformis TaxID=6347 RepID=A0A8S4PHD1_OWEFU|nr:unnamed protein product [Owenia fusiformis]
MATKKCVNLFSKHLKNTFDKQTKRCLQTKYSSKDIGFLGVPFAAGQSRGGVEHGPAALRDAGIVQKLGYMGFNVHDYGDLKFDHIFHDPPDIVKNPRSVGQGAYQVSEAVKDIISAGHCGLTIGGDHSLSIGTVHGHCQAEENVCLIWVDAHADINTPLTSATGNVHGMCLSFVVHELQEYIPDIVDFDWIQPCISAKDIAYIGLRDLDPGERHIIEKLGISCYTTHEIDHFGIEYVLKKSIEAVNPNMDRPMHLSYDIDSLDPAISPSTGTPVPGGLTIREGMYIAEELAQTGLLHHIDLVEVNPLIGTKRDQNLTIFTASEIIQACFGKRRRGNVDPNYKLPIPEKPRKILSPSRTMNEKKKVHI